MRTLIRLESEPIPAQSWDTFISPTLSYRGHFGYSLWGTYTEVSFGCLPITLTHGVNEYTQGRNNYASISGGGTSTNPFNYSNFEYAITVVDGQAAPLQSAICRPGAVRLFA